ERDLEAAVGEGLGRDLGRRTRRFVEPVGREHLVDLADVRRAVLEVAVVVVGDQRLEVGRGDVDGPAEPIEPDRVGLGHTQGLAVLLTQALAQTPERAANDATFTMDLAHVFGPTPFKAVRLELAELITTIDVKPLTD